MMKAAWLLLGRIGFYIARPFMVAGSDLFNAPRVRVVLHAPDGTILLVRTWFGSQRWSFPGGGINRGESPEVAAVREVREETGLEIDLDSLKRVGEIDQTEGIQLHLIVFEAVYHSKTLPDLHAHERLEITDRLWWNPEDDLPDLSSTVDWYRNRGRDI